MKFLSLSIIVLLVATSCSNKNPNIVFNQSASLTKKESITFNPLEWILITSSVDKNAKTTSILYGNEIAANFARKGGGSIYPAGAKLSLVTWSQKEDGHWFGGNIPNVIELVELIKFNSEENNTINTSYESYIGSPLRLNKQISNQIVGERIAFVTKQKASVIP